MKSALLTLLAIVLLLINASSQTQLSKVVLKNNDVITGKLLELKPNEYIKLEITGGSIVQIPYSEIVNVYIDASSAPANIGGASAAVKRTSPNASLNTFYFESFNEGLFGLGVGEYYGAKTFGVKVPNDDAFGGFYTVNGVGYKQTLFAGIGIGYQGHSNSPNYSLPFLLDIRARLLPKKQFSPIIMAGAGLSYHDGSLGSFTFSDGIGLSVKVKDRLSVHAIATHTYYRFLSQLSVADPIVKEYWSNLYVNYVGLRLGISVRL